MTQLMLAISIEMITDNTDNKQFIFQNTHGNTSYETERSISTIQSDTTDWKSQQIVFALPPTH